MPNPAEVAVIRVRDREFEDWTSVWVQHQWAEANPLFRFSCAERDPIPDLWTLLQFKPGDRCHITLGGQPAVYGMITTRQVSYDASNHGVQLIGKGLQFAAMTSSVNTSTGSFDNKNIIEITKQCLAAFPSGLKLIGTVNPTKFDAVQVTPGELNWDFLEKLCRERETFLGSDHLGNTLLIGDHSNPVVQQLIEGHNILKMQCVHNIDHVSSDYVAAGQNRGSDDQHGRAAAEQEAVANGTSTVYKYLKIPIEQPVKMPSEMQMRAQFEALLREGSKVEATVVVQGWLRDGKDLWRAGDNVFVHSKMAMLDMVMKIQNATFTQDRNSGTLTTLDLVLPWRLKDKGYANPNYPAPTAAKTDTNAPQDPKPDTSRTGPEFEE